MYGRTYNPYHTGRTAGGSSGGEGALIGAAGSPFGIGSDVGGSIRYVHVRLDKSRIIWQNKLGCRHSSMGSLVTNQARVLWIMVAGFPWPQDQSKSKSLVSNGYSPIFLSYLCTGPMARHATDLLPMLQILAEDNAPQLQLESEVDLDKLRVYWLEDDGGFPVITPVHRFFPSPFT